MTNELRWFGRVYVKEILIWFNESRTKSQPKNTLRTNFLVSFFFSFFFSGWIKILWAILRNTITKLPLKIKEERKKTDLESKTNGEWGKSNGLTQVSNTNHVNDAEKKIISDLLQFS